MRTRKADVIAQLAERGQRRAARIVSRMPSPEGVLDPEYLDALGVRVHCELLRLSEELQFGRRIAAQLTPMVARLRTAPGGVIRVVDVGCGLGYALRFFAAGSDLGPDVQLVGLDLNPALVARARALAAQEGLACEFICGNAFDPPVAVRDPSSTIFISSGLMHHIPGQALADFFAAQARIGVAAFAHWDITPCMLSTLGGVGIPSGPDARAGLQARRRDVGAACPPGASAAGRSAGGSALL
jgi:SAM-dependent methyltransferase